jgi:hypothetical protein
MYQCSPISKVCILGKDEIISFLALLIVHSMGGNESTAVHKYHASSCILSWFEVPH